jgi:hypothetical protein
MDVRRRACTRLDSFNLNSITICAYKLEKKKNSQIHNPSYRRFHHSLLKNVLKQEGVPHSYSRTFHVGMPMFLQPTQQLKNNFRLGNIIPTKDITHNLHTIKSFKNIRNKQNHYRYKSYMIMKFYKILQSPESLK